MGWRTSFSAATTATRRSGWRRCPSCSRQMAERKMERTRENLLRVQDILREVERQLASLRRQARRAEQYRALLGEITDLDMALSARTRARLLGEITELTGQRELLTAREA